MELHTFDISTDTMLSGDELPRLDSDQTLVMIFGATHFMDKPERVREIAKVYPKSRIIGCSTSGEIFQTKLSDNTLSVAIVKFEKTSLECCVAPVAAVSESFAAGESLASQLNKPSLRGVFVLSDGLTVNGTELVRGFNTVLPETVVVTGGLAGDGDRFERTWVIKDGEPVSGYVCAVGFYGEHVHIGHGSKGGWDIFGPERQVTRASSNVLYELDGKPALELYKTYLGNRASQLPAAGLLFPLALRANENDSKSIVRTILAVDEDSQSMTFAGDIPEGSLAQLMKANFDRLINGASDAATMIKSPSHNGRPTLCVAISCVGRRLVLGERTEEELEATLDVLPEGVKQVGFYSYGEISPYAAGYCDLHNQTMTLTTITEV